MYVCCMSVTSPIKSDDVLVNALEEAAFACRIPDAPCFADEVIGWNEPEEAGIVEVDRVIGGHPVVVLTEKDYADWFSFNQ